MSILPVSSFSTCTDVSNRVLIADLMMAMMAYSELGSICTISTKADSSIIAAAYLNYVRGPVDSFGCKGKLETDGMPLESALFLTSDLC